MWTLVVPVVHECLMGWVDAGFVDVCLMGCLDLAYSGSPPHPPSTWLRTLEFEKEYRRTLTLSPGGGVAVDSR